MCYFFWVTMCHTWHMCYLLINTALHHGFSCTVCRNSILIATYFKWLISYCRGLVSQITHSAHQTKFTCNRQLWSGRSYYDLAAEGFIPLTQNHLETSNVTKNSGFCRILILYF
jgi:hypothetical protein